ncbi:MAG TPA: hypothetical protein PKK23_13930 [Nitrospirales bacterium]|nr:hypothetical protein [Nitrospirales bacterium]
MKTHISGFLGFHIPSQIINHAILRYNRFYLRFRVAEKRHPNRDRTVTDETIHQRRPKREPPQAQTPPTRQGHLGNTWRLEEVFVTIQEPHKYFGPSMDQNGATMNLLAQGRRRQSAGARVIGRLSKVGHSRFLRAQTFQV